MAIDIKEAVRIALNFTIEMYRNDKISNLTFEEIERDGNFWRVTVSFLRERPETNALEVIQRGKTERVYKVIKVGAADGEVNSMTIPRLHE